MQTPMIIAGFILLGLLAIAIGYTILIYNRLVNLKHDTAKAWSNIDVLLKQRHDELPKLVEVCKQYKAFEQHTLQQVISARSQVQSAREHGDMSSLGKAEGALHSGLSHLFAVAEAYPELRASESFIQLQARISQLENAISDRREFYNEAVNINNVRVEQFPDRIFASLFNFGKRRMLEVSPEEKSDVDMRVLFN